MSPTEKANKQSRSPPPTKEEGLAFIRQMQKELLPQAREIDTTLSYFIEMAMIHASDLQAGMVKPEIRNPEKDLKLQYGS